MFGVSVSNCVSAICVFLHHSHMGLLMACVNLFMLIVIFFSPWTSSTFAGVWHVASALLYHSSCLHTDLFSASPAVLLPLILVTKCLTLKNWGSTSHPLILLHVFFIAPTGPQLCEPLSFFLEIYTPTCLLELSLLGWKYLSGQSPHPHPSIERLKNDRGGRVLENSDVAPFLCSQLEPLKMWPWL